MKYLTQILDKRVLDPDGVLIGKVVDTIADLEGRLPAVRAILVRTAQGEVCLPFDALEFDADPRGPEGSGHIRGDIRLRSSLAGLTHCLPQDADLRLRRDILDKQIVDVQDYRVVRVNDVRLAEVGNRYCVVGVDASLRAMLRRFDPFHKPVEALARLFRHPLRSNLIAWDDVNALEPNTVGGRIRLKVSHDKIARLHPADIADIVEQLSPQHAQEVISALDTDVAAETMAEMESETQVQIMTHLPDETATDILEEMEPDEAADLLDDLPDARSNSLLGQMEPEEAQDVRELMSYDADTAGGLMTTELVALHANLTCEQTLARLRELAPKAETIYYVYVTVKRIALSVSCLCATLLFPPRQPTSATSWYTMSFMCMWTTMPIR